MSYAEGAALPVRYLSLTAFPPRTLQVDTVFPLQVAHLTAVQALYLRIDLRFPSSKPTEKSLCLDLNPDTPKTILVWGGSTAVGHHTIQLAHASGYTVYTTASP